MKRDKRIYWITTGLAMLMGATPALFYFTNAYMIDSFRHLGFPDYFRIELGIGKLLGVLLLLIPAVPRQVKEWAYVAFGVTFFSGAIAHGLVDGIAKGVGPILPLLLLITSYYYFHKRDDAKQETNPLAVHHR
ncbi:DoxX family protein [Spirosoma fluminis]